MTPFCSVRWYYLDTQDNLLGPINTATLDALFVEGAITLDTQIIREKGTDFQPYSSIFTASELRFSLD